MIFLYFGKGLNIVFYAKITILSWKFTYRHVSFDILVRQTIIYAFELTNELLIL